MSWFDARPNNIDAEPYAEVLNDLRRRMPLHTIADIAGVSRYELTRISSHQIRRIQPGTAAKLRATLPALLPSGVRPLSANP